VSTTTRHAAEGCSTQTPFPLGYLVDNWNTDQPQVAHIDPDAKLSHLLAWCWAEVHSTLVVAQACECSHADLRQVLSAVFVHRLGPLAEVLDRLTTQAIQAERARGERQ
jgi:hypothetical protein